MTGQQATRNVTHATFVIERTHPYTPARVFHAMADTRAKEKWFGGPATWERDRHEMDFRVGGREVSRAGPKGGPVHTFNAVYQDIVPDQRIVFSYDLALDDRRISVSLTTIELRPEGQGTRMLFTEQGAYLDGYDDAGAREHGTRELLDALGRSLMD